MKEALNIKTDKDFISTLFLVFCFIFLSNALKPWIDFYTPLHYQIITLTQFVILIGFLTIFAKSFYKSIDLASFIFLAYITIKFLFQVFIYFSNGNLSGAISPFYVLLRSFLIVYMIRAVMEINRNENFYNQSYKILFLYLIITFVYSILQNPLFFANTIVSEYGGNSTSGNAFGIFRSNGGIGGTVIDYANFLLAISWVAFFSVFKNKNYQKLLILIFLISSIFCFSRSLFLCMAFMFTIIAIDFSNLKRIFLSIVLITAFSIFFLYNFLFLYEGYLNWSGSSDIYRLSQWQDLFKDFILIEYLVGKELGGNTGLFVTPERFKISGDGFITGFVYDAGIIGIFLTLLVLSRAILNMSVSFKVKICIFGSLFLMLIINSGFEKLFIIFCYILSLGIVHGTNKYKEKLN